MLVPSEMLLRKAEADLATARRELKVREDGNAEAVCLHAHQCALRLLRARLAKAEVPFPETSHLVVLLELCLELEPEWEGFRPQLRALAHIGAHLQDPGFVPESTLAAEAFGMVQTFRDQMVASLR